MTTKPTAQPQIFTARPRRPRMKRVDTPPPAPVRHRDDEGEASTDEAPLPEERSAATG